MYRLMQVSYFTIHVSDVHAIPNLPVADNSSGSPISKTNLSIGINFWERKKWHHPLVFHSRGYRIINLYQYCKKKKCFIYLVNFCGHNDYTIAPQLFIFDSSVCLTMLQDVRPVTDYMYNYMYNCLKNVSF